MYLTDTIVAPATPPGQGAIAIVRLSGPRALDIARALWHPRGRRDTAPNGDSGRRLRLGEIRDPASGALVDRALALILPAPHTFTGEDLAELHCHGGIYLVRRVVALALAAGARLAEPGEFSRRAFLNGCLDLTEAEAIADLIAAPGEAALQQALAHLGGALATRVGGLRRQVLAIRAHLEAAIDFADEDLSLPSHHEIAEAIGRLLADVTLLHDSFARGRLVREGLRATIIGKPNAGKSSVMNLLLGAERAIVTPIPGTTRDVVEDTLQLGPWPLILQDTAGLRDSADPVERIGVERTRAHAAATDLVLAVFDSSRPFEPEDAAVIALANGRAGLALLNKRDLSSRLTTAELLAHGLALPVLEFSAHTADGLADLRDRMTLAAERLAGVGTTADRDGVAISRERHRDALARALTALDAARLSAASAMPPEIVAVDVSLVAEALGAITGEVSTEDVLDLVFREFCIGK
jgi:tRNA modification GTPase